MIGLRPVEKEEYRVLYDHMKRDFPADERPPFFVVKRHIRNQVYHAMFLTDEEQPVGYAIVVAPEGMPFALIMFLAVLPEARGQSYGGKLLSLLEERYSGRTLALEVEAPDAARNEGERAVRERRIRFYERAGFCIVPVTHARIFGVEMQIMVNRTEKVLSVREMMRGLYAATFPSSKWLRHIDVADAN